MLVAKLPKSLYGLIQKGIDEKHQYMGYNKENDEFCYINASDKSQLQSIGFINNFSRKIVEIIQDKEIINRQALEMVLRHNFTSFPLENNLITRETSDKKTKWICIGTVKELNLTEALLLLNTVRPNKKLKDRSIKKIKHSTPSETEGRVVKDFELPSTSSQAKTKKKASLVCTSFTKEQRQLIEKALQGLPSFKSYGHLLSEVNKIATKRNIPELKKVTLYNEIQNFLILNNKTSKDISLHYKKYNAITMHKLAQIEKSKAIKKKVALRLETKQIGKKNDPSSRYMNLESRTILKNAITTIDKTKITFSELHALCVKNGYQHSVNSISIELQRYAIDIGIAWDEFKRGNFQQYNPNTANDNANLKRLKVLTKIKSSVSKTHEAEGQRRYLDLKYRTTIETYLKRYSNSTLSVVELHRKIIRYNKLFDFTANTISRELKLYAQYLGMDFNQFLSENNFKKYEAAVANKISKRHK